LRGSCQIPAKGFFLLVRSSDPMQNGGLAPVDFVFTFPLANSGSRSIVLEDSSATQIDLVDYMQVNQSLAKCSSGVSMELKDPLADNNDASQWQCSGAEYGSGGDKGTPGSVNFQTAR
jgi:hypothetical protein